MRPSSARASAAGEGRRKTRFAEAKPGCRSSRERGSACAWAGVRLGMANAQRQAAPAQASPNARRPALAAGTTPKLRQTCSLTGAWRGTVSSTPTRSSASATLLVSGGKGAGQLWEGSPGCGEPPRTSMPAGSCSAKYIPARRGWPVLAFLKPILGRQAFDLPAHVCPHTCPVPTPHRRSLQAAAHPGPFGVDRLAARPRRAHGGSDQRATGQHRAHAGRPGAGPGI